MKEDKVKNKIIELNEAYKKIRTGIKIIERLYINNNDVGYYLWKFKKTHDQLNRKILKLIEKEQLDKDWEKIETQLKKEGE